MNTTEFTKTDYCLKHWGLVYVGDMAAASGNLHGRPGYPDGIEIRTSVIRSWDLEKDDVVLYTANSIYRCPLREHVISDTSLYLLNTVNSRSGLSAEDLEEAAWGTAENELVKLRYTIAKNLPAANNVGPSDSCVLFRWEGCDLPYIKQVVVYEKGSVRIDDLPHARQGYTSGIALSPCVTMSVRPSNEISRHFYPYGDGARPILIENTGTQKIYVNIDGRENIPVPAGAIVRAA